MSITVHYQRGGEKGTVVVPSSGTVGDLRAALAVAVAASGFKLLHKGKTLKEEGDTAPTASVGIGHGSSVMLIGGGAGTHPTPPSTPPAVAGAGATGTPVSPTPAASHTTVGMTTTTAHRAWLDSEIDRLSTAAAAMAALDELSYDDAAMVPEIMNQDGSVVHLPPADAIALKEGLLLSAKGQALLASTLAQVPPNVLMPPDASHAASHTPAPASATVTDSDACADSTDGRAVGTAPGGMTLVNPRQAAMQQLGLALGLMLRADAAFRRVSAGLMEVVDNVPRLHLDIVWTYLLRQEPSRLAEAQSYLASARAGFERAHGKDLSRLIAMKGEGAAERALYVRLRLLEGILMALHGDVDAAALNLRTAQAECEALAVTVEEAGIFTALYTQFTTMEAMQALRAAKCTMMTRAMGGMHATRGVTLTSDSGERVLSEALDVAHRLREKRNAGRMEEMALDERARRQRAYGATAEGRVVDVSAVDTLVSMGLTEAQAVWGLRQTNNHIDSALVSIVSMPEGFDFNVDDGGDDDDEDDDDDGDGEGEGDVEEEHEKEGETCPSGDGGGGGDEDGTASTRRRGGDTGGACTRARARPPRRIDGAGDLAREVHRGWRAVAAGDATDLPDYTLQLESRAIAEWLRRVA